jgi:hypothetical protein
MEHIINSDKARAYFANHPEPERLKAEKLISALDDAVNNILVLTSYNQEQKYSLAYTTPRIKDGFVVDIKVKEGESDE